VDHGQHSQVKPNSGSPALSLTAITARLAAGVRGGAPEAPEDREAGDTAGAALDGSAASPSAGV
jgi:hypothetical protein